MTRLLSRALVLVAALFALGVGAPAAAMPADPDIPLPPIPGIPSLPGVPQFPGLPGLPGLPSAPGLPSISDCKEAPTPDMPGQGIAGFFAGAPDELPPEGDPFAPGSTTTIYEQYGYAGLRWHTYDLGCGPDMMRQPDAVIGTSMSNWVMQGPIALTALTGSLTKVAFNPSFLGVFDPAMSQVSGVLHDSLFASWAPGIIALLGIFIIFKSRRQALSTTAGAIGWAVLVVLLTTALFRWPVAAGQAADGTVTGTLGAVVTKLGGHGEALDPGTAVASNVEEAIFYRAWLAGNFGSPDSETAKKYGADLFKSQALTWREAALVQSDPDAGKDLIEQKKEDYASLADKIKDEDPDAYEYLTGKRSDTRVGYAALSALGAFLALPFLLVSALLLLGCFLIVRLAVMMFPAFAVLGLFPASRGIVLGLGRTVGAAAVNAIIFGVGAGVTVAVLGVLFHPGAGTPAWLSLVLMPVFSFMMWVALKPFRRLGSVVHGGGDPFGDMTGSFGRAGRAGGRLVKKGVVLGASAMAGGAAAGAAAAEVLEENSQRTEPPQRAEARPAPLRPEPPVLGAAVMGRTRPAPTEAVPPSTGEAAAAHPSSPPRHRAPLPAGPVPRAAIEDYTPAPTTSGVPPRPTDPEWMDGEDVYRIYHPDHADQPPPAGDNADDAA